MESIKNNNNFHGHLEKQFTGNGKHFTTTTSYVEKLRVKKTTIEERTLRYRFYCHFQPYVRELIKELIQNSVPGLQSADTKYTAEKLENGLPKPLYYERFFDKYKPDKIHIPYLNEKTLLHPVKELDFSSSGSYSVYNWELFFHVPLTIALYLSKNQRYEESLKWFHYIFDPGDDRNGSTPERFWQVKPFQQTDIKTIEELMINLSTETDSELLKETVNCINEWKNNPFKPHVIARYRPSAYMYYTVMSYLDNLISWGDSLFLQDTGEAIDEANQLYIMAENLLGPKPQVVPNSTSSKTESYSTLRSKLNAFSNTLKDIEVELPFNIMPLPSSVSSSGENIQTIASIGTSPYFCVPRNNKLLEYWDIVTDRRYKIHNSLNFKGVFRQLPLWEPEIDLLTLIEKASQAGLNLSEVMGGLNQPLPLVRFKFIIQKASEICQEVKTLGNTLLSLIEKEDGEGMALLRAIQDKQMQELIDSVRYAQWQEAVISKKSLIITLQNAIRRYKHYENLLGSEADVPEPIKLDQTSLDKKEFKMQDQSIEPRKIDYDFFAEALDAAGLGNLNTLRLTTSEAVSLLLEASTIPYQVLAATMESIASAITVIPAIAADIKPVGVGAGITVSGEQLGKVVHLLGSVAKGGEGIIKTLAGLNSTVGGHIKKIQDWQLQSQQIAGEINNIYKQLLAAEIKEYYAKKEYENHQHIMQHSQEMEDFLNGEKVSIKSGNKSVELTKTTTKGFYLYLKGEAQNLHNKYFKFAFEMARKAEMALQLELGNNEMNFVQYNYMAGKEGLFAGEKLAFDLKRMEMAYFENNYRELELVKHISLAQVNPLVLLQLRLTGKCTVSIPEEVFDIGGCEGHYFRRIKTVALSIPCIAGPYTSINCTLTLTKSTIRKKSNLLDNAYKRQDNDSERFSDHYCSTSIVTSGAMNDKGIFDFNMNDERLLPFEYEGVISEWQLELSDKFRQFDYMTISDVIFHFSYTARLAGGALKNAAVNNLSDLISSHGRERLFSLRYEFPNEWSQFVNQKAVNSRYALDFEIKETHYPYWSRGQVNSIIDIVVYALSENSINIYSVDGTKSFKLEKNSKLTEELYPGKVQTVQSKKWENLPLPKPIDNISVLIDRIDILDMWVLMRWSSDKK